MTSAEGWQRITKGPCFVGGPRLLSVSKVVVLVRITESYKIKLQRSRTTSWLGHSPDNTLISA